MTLIATGLCVNSALEAADMLAKDGVSARVVNIHTIKPLDVELVVESAKATGKVVTVEEHSLSEAWAARFVKLWQRMRLHRFFGSA